MDTTTFWIVSIRHLSNLHRSPTDHRLIAHRRSISTSTIRSRVATIDRDYFHRYPLRTLLWLSTQVRTCTQPIPTSSLPFGIGTNPTNRSSFQVSHRNDSFVLFCEMKQGHPYLIAKTRYRSMLYPITGLSFSSSCLSTVPIAY